MKKETKMNKTVMVVNADKKGSYKILVNYVQRGTELHSPELANSEAQKIAQSENANKLVLII